jgi:hypothetical protein
VTVHGACLLWPSRAWYRGKAPPSFADVLAAAAQQLWRDRVFCQERSRFALYRIPGGLARSTRRCRLTERYRRIRPGTEKAGKCKSPGGRFRRNAHSADLRGRSPTSDLPGRSRGDGAPSSEADGDQRRVGPLEETGSWKRDQVGGDIRPSDGTGRGMPSRAGRRAGREGHDRGPRPSSRPTKPEAGEHAARPRLWLTTSPGRARRRGGAWPPPGRGVPPGGPPRPLRRSRPS